MPISGTLNEQGLDSQFNGIFHVFSIRYVRGVHAELPPRRRSKEYPQLYNTSGGQAPGSGDVVLSLMNRRHSHSFSSSLEFIGPIRLLLGIGSRPKP